MKRRDFMARGASGALGVGLAGCSTFNPKIYEINEPGETPLELEKKVPKPVGTMPMGEIGTTGMMVSRFGFGSHIRPYFRPYTKEREWMVREAYDFGINFFDMYDKEHEAYQYEPMGRYLAPIIHDVLISIAPLPYDGRTFEQEFERDVKIFGKGHIDLVRIHMYTADSKDWWQWETLFKYKEQGKIRAVGVPIHSPKDLYPVIETYPLDFVILPYNFYHNWYGMKPQDFDPVITDLHKKGIGVITMKPHLGDRLAGPFMKMAAHYDETGEVVLAKADLRYIINSRVAIDSTLCGMMNPYHLYENIDAYFHPEMSDAEKKLLKKLREVAKINNITKNLLPDHYQFLEDLVPDSWDDSDLFVTV